jgi:hypothetical protein
MPAVRRFSALIISFIVLAQFGAAQRVAIDSGRSYFRLWAVAPIIGAGTLDDPTRPKYAPAPNFQSPQSRAGIIGYQFIKGDDGLALVQYVAGVSILRRRSSDLEDKGEAGLERRGKTSIGRSRH